VSFGDASVNASAADDAVRVQARVLDVNLTCTANWEYRHVCPTEESLHQVLKCRGKGRGRVRVRIIQVDCTSGVVGG
jgi:hypothetical protein